MAVALSDEIEDLITCSVCFMEYDNKNRAPKFLQCYHTVCLRCLESLFSNNSILCPLCRSRTACLQGVALLKTNYYALHLGELNKRTSLTSPRQDLWCLICSSLAVGGCVGNHYTLSIPSKKEADGAKLQKALDDCKEKLQSAADKWSDTQNNLRLILDHLKGVEADVNEQLGKSLLRQDTLLAARKNLADMKGPSETFQSFWKRIDNQNLKTQEEIDILEKMKAEQEHESSLKIKILLETADKQKIPTFTCFEDGFYGDAAKSKESVLLRHMIFAVLKKQNISLKAPSPPRKPEPVTVVHSGICIVRDIQPATDGLRRSDFILSFYRNAVMIGQVQIKPYSGFNQKFLDDLKIFVNNPQTFNADISKANPKMFLKMDFINQQFRPVIPKILSNSYATQPLQVGFCRDNGNGVQIFKFIFMLKPFMPVNMESSALFGDIISGQQFLNDLSCIPNRQRGSYAVQWSRA